MNEARRQHDANVKQAAQELIKLYTAVADDLEREARLMGDETISKRWATDYAASLRKRVDELGKGIYSTVINGAKRSSRLPTAADMKFFTAASGMSFSDVFSRTPDDALARVLNGGIYRDKAGLSRRIWGITRGLERDIDYIVNRGIAEKKSAYQIAQDLRDYVDPKAKRGFNWGKVYPNLTGKRVDFNAQRLSRTAINHTYWLDNVKTCEANPFVEAMHWELSSEHFVRQVLPFGEDECDEYAEHDEGLGIGNFYPENLPLPHPQCLCVQWGVVPYSMTEVGDEIGRWLAGGANAKLDHWYGVNFLGWRGLVPA